MSIPINIVKELLYLAYHFIFFLMLCRFLPLRKNHPVVCLVAFAACGPFLSTAVYLNELICILLPLCQFSIYIVLFHKGKWIEKVTAILTFYPLVMALNFLMENITWELFFSITKANLALHEEWPERIWSIRAAFYAMAYLLRLLIWIGIWKFIKTSLAQITLKLTIRMWLIVDSLMLVSSVSIFTTMYFITGQPVVIYPLCLAAVLSSLGCVYLLAHISESVQAVMSAQKLKMQQIYYQDKLKEEERVRAIYHDMKNHLLVLERQGEGKRTSQLAVQLREQLAGYDDYIHTGNDILDVIVKDKSGQARKKQIDLAVLVDLNGIEFIEPFDISTIFGNGIDNALEASEQLPKEQRVILVKAGRVRDFVSILIENNCAADSRRRGWGTSKGDDFLHGFGIRNMKKTVQKYGGQCNTGCKNGKFSLKILIPVN